MSLQLLSIRFPNVAGRGERISSDFTYGSKNAVGWSVSFNKPLFANPNHKLVMSLNLLSLDSSLNTAAGKRYRQHRWELMA
jgi:outer membrane protein assembly factor BamA